MGSGLLGGLLGGDKPDMTAYQNMVKEAKARASEAEKEAAAAKEQQRQSQEDIAAESKARRANAASRFSLLLFEDLDDDTLGA